MIDDFLRDLRHGARLLGKNPVFSFVVTATLAIAIGASVTVFSIVDAWLLRPLSFPESDRLVVGLYATRERPTEPAVFALHRDYLQWVERSRSFDALAAGFPRVYLLQSVNETSAVNGLVVTSDFFRVLGRSPHLGRVPSDENTTAAAAVLSYGLWQRQFGGAADVLGKVVTMNGVPRQIVAVMPADFDLRLLDQSRGFELWTFFQSDEPGYGPSGMGGVAVFGRLRAGGTIEAAHAELSRIHIDAESRYSRNAANYLVLLSSMQGDNTRSVRTTLIGVGGAVICLLFAACLNVATLLVGRGLGRTREASIRTAIGAARGRLVRQFLTESALLAFAGGITGVGIAVLATRSFVAWNPLDSLPANAIGLDQRAVMFSILVTIVVTLVCGVAPAIRTARTDPAEGLRGGGDRGASAPTQRTQNVLLVVQVGVSIVLLVATALLVQSFRRLTTEPLGFDTDAITVASLALPTDRFDSSGSRNRFVEQFSERVTATASVEAIAVSTSPVLLSSGPPVSVALVAGSDRLFQLRAQDVSTNFFATLGVPVIAGRGFDERDLPGGPLVAIVNERAANDLVGSSDAALGRRILIGRDSWHEIVGVVANVRSTFFNTLAWVNDPIVYFPRAQGFDVVRNPTIRHFELHAHIRSSRALALTDMKATVASIDPGIAVTRLTPTSDLIASATKQPALRMLLLAWFAATTLMLAAIGVYGLVTQQVALRRREFGIRLALGAAPRRLVAGVTSRALLLSSVGSIVGCALALTMSSAMKSVVYGVQTTDLLSFAVAVTAMLSITVIAALGPAFRARRIDPATVLQSE